MVWSHYVNEAKMTDSHHYSDDDVEDELRFPKNRPLEFQDWLTWYSNDLHNMWSSLRTYAADTGNTPYLLDGMEWTDFCEFCYRFSCKLPSRYPS